MAKPSSGEAQGWQSLPLVPVRTLAGCIKTSNCSLLKGLQAETDLLHRPPDPSPVLIIINNKRRVESEWSTDPSFSECVSLLPFIPLLPQAGPSLAGQVLATFSSRTPACTCRWKCVHLQLCVNSHTGLPPRGGHLTQISSVFLLLGPLA